MSAASTHGAISPSGGLAAGAMSTTSLTTRVYERLHDDVVFGRIPPGTKLKIEMLQARYDCGATPIREALGFLCNTGMVERIEQRGFRVAPVSLRDYADLMSTRCLLEERTLREAMRCGGREWEERIVLAQFHLQKGAVPGEQPDAAGIDAAAVKDWEARHAVFHAALISASPSKRLLSICSQLYAESNRYRYIARHGAGRAAARAGSYEEHRRIAEAVLGGDSDVAVRCLLEHYQRTADLLAQTLRANETSPYDFAGTAAQDVQLDDTAGSNSARSQGD